MYLNAPMGYTDITMLSTIVVELMHGFGNTQNQAEAKVKAAFGVTDETVLAKGSGYENFLLNRKQA